MLFDMKVICHFLQLQMRKQNNCINSDYKAIERKRGETDREKKKERER